MEVNEKIRLESLDYNKIVYSLVNSAVSLGKDNLPAEEFNSKWYDAVSEQTGLGIFAVKLLCHPVWWELVCLESSILEYTCPKQIGEKPHVCFRDRNFNSNNGLVERISYEISRKYEKYYLPKLKTLFPQS